MEDDERQVREREHVQLMVDEMWEDERALWAQRPVTSRITVSQGSILVLWKTGPDMRPITQDAFVVTEIKLDKKAGLQVWVESRRFMKLGYAIAHKPSMLAGDSEVFAWVPFFPRLAYTPHPGGRGWITRAEVCARTRSRADSPVVGDTYLTPVGEFRARFRDFAEVRF